MDEHNADATLLRPAVDPTVPRAAREVLLAHAGRAGHFDILPAEPERRLATVNGAASGLTAGMLVAVTGAVPWAVGVLIFQGAASWQSATGRYALMLMEMIVVLTSVVFATRVARSGQVHGRPAAAARYRGRYLTGAHLDAPARVLLRRAQEAIDVVTGSEVSRAGLLDEVPALAAQEWDIAVSLREQARLRAQRAEVAEATGITEATVTAATGDVLRQHLDAARAAERSVTDRIAAIEHYADEVRAADAAYRDRQARARLAELTGPHLDLLARTAADAHGIAELSEMTERAAAIREALRDDD